MAIFVCHAIIFIIRGGILPKFSNKHSYILREFPMHPLEIYLQDIAEIRASGVNVKELSFYPALKDLLDAVGKELKPKVCSILSLKNQGAGLPDGGLFTTSQL